MNEPVPSLDQIRQIKISDQVASYIVQLIADGQLAPGDDLPSESELARRFGVGRPAVREATNALAGRGLIAITSGRGPKVLPLTKGSFADLFTHGLATRQVSMIQVLDVRRGLEEVAAELAALNRTEDEAATLRDLADQMVEAHGDVSRFSPIDVLFHRTLAVATRNILLSSMLSGIADVARESTRTGLAYARTDAEWDVILAVHRNTAAAVIAGDAASARQHMAAHFDSALGRLRRGPQTN
jgi:DNA-binding FadR family transcriptional regulator